MLTKWQKKVQIRKIIKVRHYQIDGYVDMADLVVKGAFMRPDGISKRFSRPRTSLHTAVSAQCKNNHFPIASDMAPFKVAMIL